MSRWTPLARPWESVPPPSAAERACWRVPVFGWAVAYLLECSRLRPAINRARRQVRARPAIPRAAWGDDAARRELAFFLCATVELTTGLPHDRLAPDDAMEILCRPGRSGNPGKSATSNSVNAADAADAADAAGATARDVVFDSAAALAIKDRLREPLPPDQWRRLAAATLGQAVELLLPLVWRFCPNCRYDLTGNVSGVCPECGQPLDRLPGAESYDNE